VVQTRDEVDTYGEGLRYSHDIMLRLWNKIDVTV